MRTLTLRRPAPMRIADNMRKCVVFFGYVDNTPRKGGIDCIGTGFLLWHGGIGYLVTAKHLSHALGNDPFLIRLNKHDGTSENLVADGVDWINHPDPTVDISLVPLNMESIAAYDILFMNTELVMFKPGEFGNANIGVGNFTYTIRLFHLLSGEKRSLPVCHFGTIAMLPEDEKIPIVDWTDPDEKKRMFVEGYLIESQSLNGLSGSPVFVRPELKINLTKILGPDSDNKMPTFKPVFNVGYDGVYLLGLWQGAWEAPPDEILAVQAGNDVRVPVGMGIVVPYQRIIEVLEMPEAKETRGRIIADHQAPAAKLDAARRGARKDAPPASDANPKHREDFMRLVSEAARKPAQED